MWLRHAVRLVAVICIFSACSLSDRQATDKLNSLSYAYHYRNLDSTLYYARQALECSRISNDAKAEALNNLSFVYIARMEYDKAETFLDSIPEITNNLLEILLAEVQQMRLCQRRSRNREFYDHREKATQALARINEERTQLTARQLSRLTYAESEMSIVTSAYFFYVGLQQQSIDALSTIDTDNLRPDTAQWMNYLYNMGAGGMIIQGNVTEQEFDYLIRCVELSSQFKSLYFHANALEAVAELLADPMVLINLLENRPSGIDYLNKSHVEPYALSLVLAHQALDEFTTFGDIYQIAGAYRTLATCYWARGDYENALFHLKMALSDSAIQQAPDLVASIREQMSVAYSAVDDKPQSDFNRNQYLDLQEQTRQDRSLEARAGQLDAAVDQLNILLLAVGVGMLLLLVTFRLYYVYYRKEHRQNDNIDEIANQREQVEELLAMAQMKRRESERHNLEQRAKISLLNSLTPLIDRMLHEVRLLDTDFSHREVRLAYISELADNINDANTVLTQWIQLRQGKLNLHIESFPLQPLFEVIEKSQRSFALKGLKLEVEPTMACVKADRILTLFMLNTLADNARKFTETGLVRVYARENDRFVEISVSDTGKGMDEEELSHVFEHKVKKEHGFGLLNCRGIIEKYRKTSKLFDVCMLSAESKKGQGSRFFFRLPIPLVAILFSLSSVLAIASPKYVSGSPEETLSLLAAAYADSTYQSNIEGSYEHTIEMADSCRHVLNRLYQIRYGNRRDTLQLNGSTTSTIVEIEWLHQDVQLNYNIMLVMRNETAVAALALHDWTLYQYNNRIYTMLFKELSADQSLNDYCRRMQQARKDRMVAIILLVVISILFISTIAIRLFQAAGQKMAHRQRLLDELEITDDNRRRVEMEEARLHISNQVLDNCLSAMKHETMYYPSRIRQLISAGDIDSLQEIVNYYRELYGILNQQANIQAKSVHLHLKHLDHEVIGDENLIDYLFEILRKLSGQKSLKIRYGVKDNEYVECSVELPGVQSTTFQPSVENIPYLICRQIVREHGEYTGRRACGISSESTESGSRIIITLPRQQCKNSK